MAVKRDLLRERLMDPKSYNTVYINKEDEEKVRQEQMETLVELLCDPRYKGGLEEVYKFLKKEKKAVELLMRAIQEARGDKKRLVTVCWEADIDCTDYLNVFANIVINDEFPVAIEALTVIENITGEVPAAQITPLINKVKENYSADSPKAALYMDLIELLSRWQ